MTMPTLDADALFNFEPLFVACLLLVLALFVQTIRLWWKRGEGARRMNRNRKHGQIGERHAEKLLGHHGFQILKRQVQTSYEYEIDGRPQLARLAADFLVFDGNSRFIAEVKSGDHNASPRARATRRQLLEYQLAFDVDGVLLVDMNQKKIHIVSFPDS
ncbi:MAG: hypothetical protein MK135_10955 [Polyangiaceae bacterium]|nr:hypothetical protein [Polyangiaceae bacterium]